MVFALGVRLYRLDARDLWEDEQVTLVDSLGIHVPEEVTRDESFPARTLHTGKGTVEVARFSAGHDQPIYVTLVHLWTRLVRPSEWTLRLPSALLGALSVPLLALVGARLLGTAQGSWAAALLAVAPLHVSYSQEARTYAVAVFLVLLSWAACLWVGDREERWAWVVYGALAATVPAIHLLATIALVPQGAWLLGRPAGRRRWIYAVASGIFLLGLLTPLGFLQSVVTAHQDSGVAFQHPPPELQEWALPTTGPRLLSGLVASTTRLVGLEYPAFGLRARGMVWLSAPLLVAGAIAISRVKPRSAALVVTGAALLPLVTATLLSLAYGHVVPLQDRYSAWTMPFFALAFAEVIVQLPPALRRGAGTGLVLTLGLFLAKLQLPMPPRTTPRAEEVRRLSTCVEAGEVLGTNDPTEAAVVAAWTDGPLLLAVKSDGGPGSDAVWEVHPGTGTVCRASTPSACAADFPPCLPSRPRSGS
jgi:uncharacterized membrane protein